MNEWMDGLLNCHRNNSWKGEHLIGMLKFLLLGSCWGYRSCKCIPPRVFPCMGEVWCITWEVGSQLSFLCWLPTWILSSRSLSSLLFGIKEAEQNFVQVSTGSSNDTPDWEVLSTASWISRIHVLSIPSYKRFCIFLLMSHPEYLWCEPPDLRHPLLTVDFYFIPLFLLFADPWYLDVGESIVKSLNLYTKVAGGFASVRDVTTMQLEDHQHSFFLAETWNWHSLPCT